jgi:hypothetical protein
MSKITKLYAAFETKVAAFNAIRADKIRNPEFDRAVTRAVSAARKTINTPAATLRRRSCEGPRRALVRRPSAARSARHYVPDESLATEETDALCAVREDLRRLLAGREAS